MFKQNTIDGKCYSAPSANCKKYHIDIFDGAQLNFDPRLNSIFQQNFKRLFNTKEFVPHKKLEIHTDFMDEQCSIRCDPKFSGKPWNDTVSACIENTERRYKKEYPYAVTYGILKALFCVGNQAYAFLHWFDAVYERSTMRKGLYKNKYKDYTIPNMPYLQLHDQACKFEIINCMHIRKSCWLQKDFDNPNRYWIVSAEKECAPDMIKTLHTHFCDVS